MDALTTYWPDVEFFTANGHIPADFVVDGFIDPPRVRAVHRPTGVWVPFPVSSRHMRKDQAVRVFTKLLALMKLHDSLNSIRYRTNSKGNGLSAH